MTHWCIDACVLDYERMEMYQADNPKNLQNTTYRTETPGNLLAIDVSRAEGPQSTRVVIGGAGGSGFGASLRKI